MTDYKMEETINIDNNTINTQAKLEVEEETINTENTINTQVRLEVEEANRKLQKANVMLCRIDKSRQVLKKRIKRLRYEKERLRYEKEKIAEENLKLKSLLKLKLNIFNEDQIKVLTGKNSHSVKWSDSTIMKALRLKFLCGSNGYNELLTQQIPLPSERTLRRKKESVNFQEGILHNMFDKNANY